VLCLLSDGNASHNTARRTHTKHTTQHNTNDRYGEIVKIDIKRDKVTNNNLGYGFVQYRTPMQAQVTPL
jgi:hypothetical protein